MNGEVGDYIVFYDEASGKASTKEFKKLNDSLKWCENNSKSTGCEDYDIFIIMSDDKKDLAFIGGFYYAS